MRKQLYLLWFLIAVPALILAQNDSREYSGYLWYDDGITFTYSFSLAEDAIAQFIPASADTAETLQIIFQNYHGDAGWIPTGAEVDIMPLRSLPTDYSALPDTAIFEGHEAKLDFQTGTGTRFVAAKQNESGAINLVYRYEGQTSDDVYGVSASFPLKLNSPADSVPMDAQALAGLPGDAVAPSLDSLDALVRSLSVTAPEASLLTSETGGAVDYENIHFRYDPLLAYRVEVDRIQGISGEVAENTMFGPVPTYQEFTLVGYPAPGHFQTPQLFVMPVSQFPGDDQRYGAELLRLQTALEHHAALSAVADSSGRKNPLPLLPLINAAQTIVAQPQYLHFSNGEGLRYLTFYAQDSVPVTANDLFYVFVGITADQHQVISARFPVYAGFLPDGTTAYNMQDIEQFNMHYGTYLDGLLVQIEAMADSAFLPQISTLDALIASVEAG